MSFIFQPLGQLLGGLFGNGGQIQQQQVYQPAPAVPQYTDPAIQAAATAQANAAAAAKGRASTIATSGQGDTSTATIAKKTLLGGG